MEKARLDESLADLAAGSGDTRAGMFEAGVSGTGYITRQLPPLANSPHRFVCRSLSIVKYCVSRAHEPCVKRLDIQKKVVYDLGREQEATGQAAGKNKTAQSKQLKRLREISL